LTDNINSVRLLVVSREPAAFRLLGPREASQAWHLETVSNGWEAMERMQSGAASDILVLDIPRLDISFKDSEAMHFLRWLRSSGLIFPRCCCALRTMRAE
jgi:CheY-like chemotaxis protein